MRQTFVAYPTKGFLNTDFNVRSKESIRFVVLFNGNKLYEDSTAGGQTKKLPKFSKPGEYVISTIDGKERQSIVVEDALRLGNSELKKAYVFDDCPYVIFVMKDRIHFFDPSIESYVYTENFLTPNDIKLISTSKLLFMSQHPSGMSLSTFDIEDFSIEDSIECEEIIAHSDDFQLLYVKKGHKLVVVNSLDLTTKATYTFNEDLDSNNCWVNSDGDANLLFCLHESLIVCIDINTGATKTSKRDYAIGITNNGYLVTNGGTSLYGYKDMNPHSEIKDWVDYRPLYDKFTFKGHSIPNAPWEKNSFDGDEASSESNESKVKKALVEFQKYNHQTNNSLSYFSKEIVIGSSALMVFFPSKEGVYIIEEITVDLLNIRYDVKTQKHRYYTSNKRERKLIWLSPTENKIEYTFKRNSYYDEAVVNGIFASFPLNSTKSALVEKGVIVEITDGSPQASGIVKVSDKPNEEDIVINGDKISPKIIVAKDENVMLIKTAETYTLYRKQAEGLWTESNVCSLEERKHMRAAMSKDGKYLVYSKGGNQYALYNIDEDKEETVLTGSFVDFDESGNLIFSDKPRQLRIYDPVTFEWKKTSPQYYNFVSPDGKLFAKTSQITRYYNLIEGNEIDSQTYFSLKRMYDSNGVISKEELDKRNIRRKEFYHKHQHYFDDHFEELKDEEKRKYRLNDYALFTDMFLEIKQYVMIGVVGTDQMMELELNILLDYLNYVSFSYDNQYVAIVGKPFSNGYLKIVKIDYDESNKSLQVVDEVCDMVIGQKATWTCAFSKQGLLGTYDSSPNLYLIRKSDHKEFVKDRAKDYDYLKEHLCIPNKSLMCFSPSGKYMALSNQGYEPISLGGRGHVPSNEMFIYRTDDYSQVDEWQYQGEGVLKLSPYDPYKKNLVQAGFSIDERKIMTVSGDGVVIVRNLHLEEINQNMRT